MFASGDDLPSVQTMVELVWEYSAQMEALQLTNPCEYVALCRQWKQRKLERELAIQSSGQTEAHLPAPTSGSSQQQWLNPLNSVAIESRSSTEQRAQSNSVLSLSSTPTVTASAGVCPPAGEIIRLHPQSHTSTRRQSASETAGTVTGASSAQRDAPLASHESALNSPRPTPIRLVMPPNRRATWRLLMH